MKELYSELNNFLLLPVNIIVVILAIEYLIKGRKELKFYSYYFVVAFIFQTIQYLTTINGIHNIFLFHLFTPVQFVLIAWNLKLWEHEYDDLYKVTISLITLLIISNCIHSFPNDITNSTPAEIPVMSLVLESLVITAFALRAVLVLNKRDYRLYFVFATLFYFTQSAGFFYLYQLTDLTIPLLEHKISVIISHIIFIVGYARARH